MIESSNNCRVEDRDTLVDRLAGVIEEGLQVGEVSETESSYTLFGTVNNEVSSVRKCCLNQVRKNVCLIMIRLRTSHAWHNTFRGLYGKGNDQENRLRSTEATYHTLKDPCWVWSFWCDGDTVIEGVSEV